MSLTFVFGGSIANAQPLPINIGKNINVTAGSNSAANIGSILGNLGPVQGHYVDSRTGLQIDLPSGWSGYTLLGFAVVAPGGFNFDFSKSISPPQAEMGIASMNASMTGQATSPPSFNATSMATNSFCPNSQASIISVNGIPAFHFVGQGCQSQLPDQHTDGYIFFTKSGSFVAIAFIANNTSLYNKYIGDFQGSINSVKLENAQDVMTAMSSSLHLKSNDESVKLQNNNEQSVTIDSSSDISDFKFSDTDKSISFTVSGTQGTTGNTYVRVSNVLQGPYTVTLDGKPVSFSTIKDESTGDILVSLQYHHSSHTVTITGASVAPEFPLGLLPLVVAITIGAIVAAAKRKWLS